MNIKKQWEVFEPGRAQKAMETRRRFLDSLLIKDENQTIDNLPELADDQVNNPTTENLAENKKSPTASDIQESAVIPPHSSNTERLSSSGASKKRSTKDQATKQPEVIATPPSPVIIEPFLNESPFVQTKIQLPPLDRQSFMK